ncbi:nitrite reductase small subunit NirD [Agrilactobacillus yilanensis]|uniref:Nitrite reductase small subunit NirD n=1 Tax=Agrilactobacillus yilanensis TaxID=2485997 RepID=A0ABW4JAX3_9LACO|nr:nitrite reductase small subunit NirD [Agrilactobacillus yilanensis]
MTQKVYIAEVADLPLKMGLEVKNGAESIAVFKLSDTEIYAIGNICPHAGGPLADGMVSGKEVICPLHSLHLNLVTGQPITEDDLEDVPVYETAIEAGKFYIMV